jgi:acyl-lipid omega-6 desaturase (Delta-12 desaturase)
MDESELFFPGRGLTSARMDSRRVVRCANQISRCRVSSGLRDSGSEKEATMSSGQNSMRDPDRASKVAWRSIVEKCQQPSTPRAVWQLVNTLVPYALLWYLMYRTLEVSLWLTIPPAVIAGALLVRVFIIFHDCGHGSYFKSRRANDVVGFLAGVLTFTPYYHWRWEHAIHHGTAGHLDKRGTGDVWTMTVQEYIESSRGRRFAYQLARNPLVLFVFAPLFVFVIRQRFASSNANPRERRSVWLMNLAILCVAAVLSRIFGIAPYLLIQSTIMLVAGAAGVWLFYVQHQFEDAYWERGDNWNYTAAALQGSSYYKLPRILQWFSGNIGFHHIHHLSPRIPNYNLQKCHESDPLFQQVKPITLASSLKSLAFRLWDEEGKKLVGYGQMRQRKREQQERTHGRDQPPRNRT